MAKEKKKNGWIRGFLNKASNFEKKYNPVKNVGGIVKDKYKESQNNSKSKSMEQQMVDKNTAKRWEEQRNGGGQKKTWAQIKAEEEKKVREKMSRFDYK